MQLRRTRKSKLIWRPINTNTVGLYYFKKSFYMFSMQT